MANIGTVLNTFLYAFISVLLLVFIILGCFIFLKYLTHIKTTAKLADAEANTTCATDDLQKQQPLRLLVLPAKFHLDPVVYPSAARRSANRLPSYQRVIPNPFRTRPGNKCPLVVDTTTIKVDIKPLKIDNTGISNHTINEQACAAPIPTPIPPCRPSRPSLLDDLLTGFPYEHDVARDLWFPLTNPQTGCWELSVVWGTPLDSKYVPRDGEGSGRHGDFVLTLPLENEEKSLFSTDGEEIDHTPLTPSNTIVEMVAIEKSSKSKKHDERRRKKKNGRRREHVFEIPELYVNARPYEEIEAEEARAAAEGEEMIEVEAMIEVEEEALAAVAARDTRDTREECKFLEIPEPFWA